MDSVCGRQLPCGKGRRKNGGERPWKEDLETRAHHSTHELHSLDGHCPGRVREEAAAYLRRCQRAGNGSRRCYLARTTVGYVQFRGGRGRSAGPLMTFLQETGLQGESIDALWATLRAKEMAHPQPPGNKAGPASSGDVGWPEQSQPPSSNHVGQAQQVSPGG